MNNHFIARSNKNIAKSFCHPGVPRAERANVGNQNKYLLVLLGLIQFCL